MQNKTALEHWGDLIGRLPDEANHPPEVVSNWVSNNNRALAGEVVQGEVKYTFGGETRTYYNIIAPMRDGEEVRGLVGINMDVTERVRVEEEAHRRQEHERRVEAAAEEAKRQFYKGTIFAVTQGKLNLTSHEEIEKLIPPKTEKVVLSGTGDLSALRDG